MRETNQWHNVGEDTIKTQIKTHWDSYYKTVKPWHCIKPYSKWGDVLYCMRWSGKTQLWNTAKNKEKIFFFASNLLWHLYFRTFVSTFHLYFFLPLPDQFSLKSYISCGITHKAPAPIIYHHNTKRAINPLCTLSWTKFLKCLIDL